MEQILNRCFCGKIPNYVQERDCFGHGEYPMIGYVKCSCGVKTKGFIVDGSYGETTTKEDVINFWNEKHPIFVLCSSCDIDEPDLVKYEYSRLVSSCPETKIRMYLSASPSKGIYIQVLQKSSERFTATIAGEYKPKFCPECGRDLRKINGFIKGDEK